MVLYEYDMFGPYSSICKDPHPHIPNIGCQGGHVGRTIMEPFNNNWCDSAHCICKNPKLNPATMPKPLEFGEPAPVKNKNRAIQEAVISDMVNRLAFGIEKYGTPLQAFNGRNSPKDAYEEILDLAQYVKQWDIERDKMIKLIDRAKKILVNTEPIDQTEEINRWVGEYESMGLEKS